MFRCRTLIIILLTLMLPLQMPGSRTCCQAGQKSCCSGSASQSEQPLSSCCSRTAGEAKPSGCAQCAAARQKVAADAAAIHQCSCDCKNNPHDRPATEQRRNSEFASVQPLSETVRLAVSRSVRFRPNFRLNDQSPGRRLHAIHCVWLN